MAQEPMYLYLKPDQVQTFRLALLVLLQGWEYLEMDYDDIPMDFEAVAEALLHQLTEVPNSV